MRKYFLLTLISLLSQGCAYFENRARDFGDCFRLSAGAGLGISADAQFGPLRGGVGLWQGYVAGLNRKSEIGIWYEKYFGIPIAQIIGAFEKDMGIIAIYFTSANNYKIEISNYKGRKGDSNLNEIALVFVFTPDYYCHEPRLKIKWTDYFWIQASASCFIHVNVGFNVAELFDFVLGWFGIDIAGDDKVRGDKSD